MNSYFKTKKITYNGEVFDSKFELQKKKDLDLLSRAGVVKGYERQVRIPLVVNGYTVCTYVIDFIVTHNDGSKEYIETKGYPTNEWKLKWKLFEALFIEENKLTVEYQKDIWLSPVRKQYEKKIIKKNK